MFGAKNEEIDPVAKTRALYAPRHPFSELVTCGNEIHAHHFFGNGMLHLETGVHLQKIEIAVLVHQKLDRAGP